MAHVRWFLFPSELSPTGWEVDRLVFHFQRHCIASLRNDARNANRTDGENEENEDYGNQEFDGNVVEEEIGTQE